MTALAYIKICSCFAMALDRAAVTAIRDQVFPLSTLLREVPTL